MANADATASTSTGGETESENNDEMTESSENIFLQSISELIANSEPPSSVNESLLSIAEVKSIPQPQFGYFLPLSSIPRLRIKRFIFIFY